MKFLKKIPKYTQYQQTHSYQQWENAVARSPTFW